MASNVRLSLRRAALALACALTAGCLGPKAPDELSGLWSAGPAACDAGIGVRFGERQIAAHYAGERQVLLNAPRYEVERRGERLRVRIRYALPRTTTRGELLLERGADGWLNVLRHRLEDRRTGAARVRIGADPVSEAFHLRRCGVNAWAEGLRGRGVVRREEIVRLATL